MAKMRNTNLHLDRSPSKPDTELPPGESYLANLRRINASDRVMKAAQSAVESERATGRNSR